MYLGRFNHKGGGYACANRVRRREGWCERISRVGEVGREGERRRMGRGRLWEAASSPGCSGVRWVGWLSEQKTTRWQEAVFPDHKKKNGFQKWVRLATPKMAATNGHRRLVDRPIIHPQIAITNFPFFSATYYGDASGIKRHCLYNILQPRLPTTSSLPVCC